MPFLNINTYCVFPRDGPGYRYLSSIVGIPHSANFSEAHFFRRMRSSTSPNTAEMRRIPHAPSGLNNWNNPLISLLVQVESNDTTGRLWHATRRGSLIYFRNCMCIIPLLRLHGH